ncbi:MAG: EipA family protein, partial [Methylocella sp.]
MQTRREVTRTLTALAVGIPVLRASAVLADPGTANGRPGEFSSNEIVANGHRFFGSVSRGLAGVVEEATRRWGKPNGYV